jgi:flagellar protein FlaF
MYSQQKGNQYEKLRWKTMSGREVEFSVLRKAALLFRRAQTSINPGYLNDEVEEAIAFNRRVWEVLRSGWQDQKCALPTEIRQNLLNLSAYMAKAEIAFRAEPCAERLDSMIQVNENLAAGLEASAGKQLEAQVNA